MAFDNHKGILAVHQAVENYLLERKRLSGKYATTIRKLKASCWEKLQTALTPHSRQLTFFRDMGQGTQRHILPVYKEGETYITGRVNRLGGTVIFFASDLRKLQRCVGEDLASYGAIDHPDDVKYLSPNNHQAEEEKSVSLLDQMLSKAVYS